MRRSQSLQLCAIDEKTEIAERAAIETYSSPALEGAFLSSKSFWSFITNPSTKYMDRMVAANRGGSLLQPEDLPLLWNAIAEISSVPSGVSPNFCSAIAMIPKPPTIDALRGALFLDLNRSDKKSTSVVLGNEIKLPENTLSHPVTAEERDRSPWLWQMQRALSTLFEKTNMYYGDIRYPARVSAAWGWSISVPSYQPGKIVRDLNLIEWNKISIRSRALTEGAPHDILLFQTILKLALNNDEYYVASTAPVRDLESWGADHHLEELAQAAQIIILQKTLWQDVAAQAAFAAASAARYNGDTMPHAQLVKTAGAVLAIGGWAMDRSLGPWTRYYSFIQPICRIVDDSPCSSTQIRDPNDSRLSEELKAFETWFEKRKSALELEAKTEKCHLKSLAKELQTDVN